MKLLGKSSEIEDLSRFDTFGGVDPRGLVPLGEPTLLTIPTYDGSGQATHPSVVYIPEVFGGHRWWMAMTPYPKAAPSKENPSILCSDDGIKWAVPTGVTNPLFGPPESSNYSDPHLVFDYFTSKLYLYWNHNGVGVFRASSSDGVVWSGAEAVTVAGGLPTSESIEKLSANEWVMYSCPGGSTILRYTSADGLAWGHPTEIDLDFSGWVWHGWFGLGNMGWNALFMVAQRNRNNSHGDLFFARSQDGLAFKVYPVPILSRTRAKERMYAVYRSCLVVAGDIVRIYYGQWSSDNVWRIGYMDCRMALEEEAREFPAGRVQINAFDALEIRDTTTHHQFLMSEFLKGPNWWNRYKHKAIMCTNSFDQAVELKFNTSFRGNTITQDADPVLKYNNGTPQTIKISIPAGTTSGATILITEADAPILGQLLPNEVYLDVIGVTTPPTTGTLSLRLIMWN